MDKQPLVRRHAEARRLLQDPRLAPPSIASIEAAAASLGVELEAFLRSARGSVIFATGSRHRALSRSLATWAGPKAVEMWTEAAGDALDCALQPLEGRERFDAVQDFAAPLCARLLETLCGVPRDESPRVGGWLEDVTALIAAEVSEEPARAASTLQAADRAVAELTARLPGWTAERGRLPKGPHGALEPSEHASQLIAVAQSIGITLRDQLAMAVHALCSHREALARFTAEPALRRSAVEELLRFAPTDRVVVRTVAEPLEVAGESCSVGDEVAISLADANRDPEVFEQPNALTLDRHPNPHLSFSAGPHGCPGFRPASAVLALALGRLAESFPDLARDPERDAQWRRGPILKRPTRLPIRLHTSRR